MNGKSLLRCGLCIFLARFVAAGAVYGGEPIDRPSSDVEATLARRAHHHQSRAQFLQGVIARDRDHNGIRAAECFRKAAQSARQADNLPLSGALRLAAEDAVYQLQKTFVHGQSVEGVEFNGDKSRLLSWDSSGTIRFWDLSKDEPLASFQCDPGLVGVAFSPDEGRFLSWGRSGQARLWDVQKADPIRVFTANEKAVMGATFGKAGAPIFTWGHYHVQVWDPMRDEAIHTFEKTSNPIRDVRLNEDESKAFVRLLETLTLWDVSSGKRVRSLHNGRDLKGAVFNRKGDRVLTSYSVLFKNDRLSLWDVDREEPIWTTQAHDAIQPIAFNRDESKFLASMYSHADQIVRIGLWNADPLRLMKSYAHRSHSLSHAMLTADERNIVSWDDHDIWVWDTKREQVAGRLRHDHRIEGVSVSRDARYVLSWASDFGVRLWDVEREKAVCTFKHNHAVRGTAFNQAETAAISWSREGKVRLWSFEPRRPVHRFERLTRHDRSKLGPGGRHVLRWQRDAKAIEIWSASGDEPIRTFQSDFTVLGGATNRQGTRVLAIGKQDPNDKVWRSQLWDVEQNRSVRKIEALEPGLLAINHDGTKCVTSQWSGADVAPFITEVTLWDISREKAKPIHRLSIDDSDPLAILSVVFDGETARYVGTCHDNYYVCDIAKTAPVWGFSQSFSDSGKYLTSNASNTKALSWKRTDEKPGDAAILLWKMPETKPVRTFPYLDEVRGAVFAKDESRFLTWRRDGTVELWDVSREKPLHTFRCAPQTAGAVFNDSATRFLAWSNAGYYDDSPRSVQLWDIAEKRLIGEFRHDGAVRGAAFHPNEEFIVSWGDDNTIRLWNDFAAEPLLRLSHRPRRSIEQVIRCDFDKPGDRIVARDREGSVAIWDISRPAAAD